MCLEEEQLPGWATISNRSHHLFINTFWRHFSLQFQLSGCLLMCEMLKFLAICSKTWLHCCQQWRYPKWWEVSLISTVSEKGCVQFVAYREGREANQWCLGDKCSVPTGPRSSYVDDWVVLIQLLTTWPELRLFSPVRSLMYLKKVVPALTTCKSVSLLELNHDNPVCLF